MLSRFTGALIPPYLRPTPVVRWINRLGRPPVWIFWRLVELLLYFQCRLGTEIAQRQNLVPSKPVEIDAFGESTMIPRPALYKFIRQGRIAAHRTEIAAFTRDGVVLRDGDTLGLDCVVFGTGWKNDYSFLSAELRDVLETNDDDGFYLYRHMLHPDVPNLIFIGHTATYLNILTDCLQARWLAELLTGRLRLPSREAMLAEIAQLKSWKRAWMPFSPARGARLQLHMLHYHDELLDDIGANPLRKRGLLAPLKELLAPYQPSDYRAVVAGDWGRPGSRGLQRDRMGECRISLGRQRDVVERYDDWLGRTSGEPRSVRYKGNDCYRRIFLVAARSGKGLLSERRAGALPWRRNWSCCPTPAIEDCHVRSNMPEEKSGIDIRLARFDWKLNILPVSAWFIAGPIFKKNRCSYRRE